MSSPLGKGRCHQILIMNLIGIFCRLNTEVKMEILIILSTLRILETMRCGNTDSNFFALDPKIVSKLGNLRFGNSKTGKTG
jgi:hypothetical protein